MATWTNIVNLPKHKDIVSLNLRKSPLPPGIDLMMQLAFKLSLSLGDSWRPSQSGRW